MQIIKKADKPKGKVVQFFTENKIHKDTATGAVVSGKFETKRQASKYLNHYGKVWKLEHNINLSAPKRGK